MRFLENNENEVIFLYFAYRLLMDFPFLIFFLTLFN